MIDSLIETGKFYGMEMNVQETKVMKISRKPYPLQFVIDQKQLKNVQNFEYCGRVITNNASCM
jgi:hypothetical protein